MYFDSLQKQLRNLYKQPFQLSDLLLLHIDRIFYISSPFLNKQRFKSAHIEYEIYAVTLRRIESSHVILRSGEGFFLCFKYSAIRRECFKVKK